MLLKKLLPILLCIALLLCGCGSQPAPDHTPTAPPEPEEYASTQDSLAYFRDLLAPPVMAVAYLGYFETEPEDGIFPYLRDEYPSWLAGMDFVEQIPAERIIGSCGSLWLIVPRDPEASVTVNRVSLMQDGHFPVEEVLYRSESGEPLLILTDYSDISTLSVVVTGSNGDGITWYPLFGQMEVFPEGSPTGFQVADFSPVSEKSDYELYRRNGWYIPIADELMDSFWLSDHGWGLELLYEPGGGTFDGKALLYSVDADGAYTVTHSGSWTMEADVLVLELTPLLPDGTLISGKYPVLLDPWGDGWLWFGRADDGSALPGFPEELSYDELIRPEG